MSENKIPLSQEIKRHLLTGISWMIPLIVPPGSVLPSGKYGGTNVVKKQEPYPGCSTRLAAGGWG
jgi:PTS system fructose-specific IIC component